MLLLEKRRQVISEPITIIVTVRYIHATDTENNQAGRVTGKSSSNRVVIDIITQESKNETTK